MNRLSVQETIGVHLSHLDQSLSPLASLNRVFCVGGGLLMFACGCVLGGTWAIAFVDYEALIEGVVCHCDVYRSRGFFLLTVFRLGIFWLFSATRSDYGLGDLCRSTQLLLRSSWLVI